MMEKYFECFCNKQSPWKYWIHSPPGILTSSPITQLYAVSHVVSTVYLQLRAPLQDEVTHGQ